MTNPTELLNHRYGHNNFNPDIPWSDTLATLLSHRSIRAYLPDALPPGTLEVLIAAAQSASTSSNLQTWSVVAVEDANRKEELARLTHIAENRGLPHEGLDYLEMFLMAAIDAALAAQNAVVAAESIGLGTVYIGALRNKPEEVAQILNLPPHVVAVFGLCVGYADPIVNVAIKPRLSQSVILHRETYQLAQQEQGISEYNQIMEKFYNSQHINIPGDWSEHSSKRVASAESLSGRHRLKEILNSLGFKLQ
jgi:nitroreductase